MKTVKNIVVNIDSKFTIRARDHQSCASTARYAVTWPWRDLLCFPRDL